MLYMMISRLNSQGTKGFLFGQERQFDKVVCEKQIMPVTGVFRVDI